MEKKKERLAIKEEENSTKKKAKRTKDSRDLETEDNADMVWDRHPNKTWKVDKWNLKTKLL